MFKIEYLRKVHDLASKENNLDPSLIDKKNIFEKTFLESDKNEVGKVSKKKKQKHIYDNCLKAAVL